MKFYGTFGQNHKHYVRGSKGIVKNFYVCIYAKDKMDAGLLMYKEYGAIWSDIYEKSEFDKSLFPQGCMRELGTKTLQDEIDDKIDWIYEQRINNREIT